MLAYISEKTGQFEVYIQSIETGGEKLRISTDGGGQPRWRGDGRELFYLALDGTLMAVRIELGDKLEPGIPAALFRTGISVIPDMDQYAVTADGRRFLYLRPSSESGTSPATVVLNWSSVLEQ